MHEQEQREITAVQNRSFWETQKAAQELLSARGIDDAAVDAWYLIEYVTGMDRTKFLLERQRPMELSAQEAYLALVRRRAAHVPLQRLTGEQEFMGFKFRVREDVLIPRQDTEILVEEAVRYLREQPSGNRKEPRKVLDLCTGSGCIAICLKKMCPDIEAAASDLSKAALTAAEENGERLGADITWIESDIFENIDGIYDLIVSNPPYIRTDVIRELSDEVRLFEPRMALDGHADGLYFYRRIIGEAKNFLKAGGKLMFEIGYDQGEDVAGLLAQHGFCGICVLHDLAGLDRVVTGVFPGRDAAAEAGCRQQGQAAN